MRSILSLLALVPLCSFAQWTQELSVPASNVGSLFIEDGTLFAGTDSAVFSTTDVTLPLERSVTLPSTPDLVDAVCVYDGLLLAGTGTQGVYSSMDDGGSWQSFSNGLGGLGGTSLNSFALFGGELYCGTVGNGVFKLTGTIWQHFGTLQDQMAGNVQMLQVIGDTLWAGAGGNGYIWYFTAGDTDWTPLLVAPVDGDSHMITDIVRVPGALVVGSGYGIYRSTDNGATWGYMPGVGGAENIRLTQWGDTLFAARNTAYTRLYASTDNGLTWTLREALTLVYTMDVYADRLYTGRLDGLWYWGAGPTGIADGTPASDFRLYPVPATTEVIVERQDAGPAHVAVWDMEGRTVRSLSSGLQRIHVDLSGLASGTYTLMVDAEPGRTVRRLVVE